MAAGVREELSLLEQGTSAGEAYTLVALLHRLQDDPVSLALRIRISRLFSLIFVSVALASLGARLSPEWAVFLVFLGWISVVGMEGGGVRWIRRLGRWRRGAGYAVWSRVTQPAARLVRPLLPFRVRRPQADAPARVLAEAQATLLTGGGRLGQSERRFLRRLLASTSILVTDILTRWDAVHRIDVDASVEDAVACAHRSGHSRLPVVEEGRVVGLVTAKDLLPRIHEDGKGGTIRDLLLPVYFVRQDQTVKALLEELQKARVHLAVVVNRLGRAVGIVTMEDVLEEIVGELHDEREREEIS
jgi:CBS domain containing-hemolysin-like protein